VLIASTLALALHATPQLGLIDAQLRVDLDWPSRTADSGNAPRGDVPGLLAIAPTTLPSSSHFDRGAPPRAVLVSAGTVAAWDLLCIAAIAGAFAADSHLGSFENGHQNDGAALLFLLGGAGILVGTPAAAVQGARWGGADGSGFKAYWAAFGARLGSLAAAGLLHAKVLGGTTAYRAKNVAARAAAPYLLAEFWVQPWVATRVLGMTELPAPRPAEPIPPSPAALAIPDSDRGWP
jgi:hypothetical protein